MKLLGKGLVLRRIAMALLGVAAVLVAVLGIAHNLNKRVEASTQNGAAVNVVPGQKYYYGDWETHKYTIGSGASNYVGFCVNPTKHTNAGQYPAVLINENDEKYQKIKLGIYIYTVRNGTTQPIINDWFQTISDEGLRYAYVHAVVGYINDGSTRGLSSGQLQWLQAINQQLHNHIVGNTAVWKQASNYRLYGLNLTNPNLQNIMWIEAKPEEPRGSIVVTKKDAETHKTTPQGNASFDSITFIAKQGGAEKGRCTLSNSKPTCTIGNLLYGSYTVYEAQGSNTSYQVKVNSSKNVALNGGTAGVEFENVVKKGAVKVTKKDSKVKDGECKTTSGHSFEGITFGLYLSSGNNNPIIYNGRTIAPTSGQDPLIAKKAIGKTGCTVTFEGLPYGRYYVKEISANKYYIGDGSAQFANIPQDNNTTINVEFVNEPTSLGTTATDAADGDHYLEAGEKATIKDTVRYCVEPNKQYTIKGVLMDKSTGKELLINGKKVEGSTTIKPTSKCGTATINFTFSTESLDGKSLVVFERLYEYREDGKYDKVDPVVTHEDIKDAGQTVEVKPKGEVSLGTTATDAADGDHYLEAGEKATIKDTVRYCVEPNKQYTIKGVLMDKSTGKELLINGKKVEGSTTIKPTSKCGTATINFTFSTESLDGKSLVVFERLYEYREDGEYDKVDPVVTHEDIKDTEQTVSVVSMGTVATDKTDGDKTIVASKGAVIKDVVKYCVRPGQKYIIKGVLMNKATGEPLLINGKKIEGAMEIEPTESCGEAEMIFHFDATGLQGTEVVVFERLYEFVDGGDEGDPVIVHEDINDLAQSVIIYLPPPNTGESTTEGGSVKGTKFIVAPALAVLGIGGYVAYRVIAKKRFLNKM